MTDHVEAPSTRPEFVIPVRPTGVPPGLCELRPDIHVVGIEPHGAHYTTAAKLAGYILETIERQAAGRFYLWEAAQILAETHEKSPQGIKNAMRKAFSLGVLRVRMTDSDAPMDSDSRLRVEGMDSYVTPGDLNKWLETDGYPYRFPAAPEPASTPIEEAAAPIPASSASAPAVAPPEPVVPPADAAPQVAAWTFIPSKRETGYGADLNDLLESLHKSGEPIPTAAKVIEIWKANPPRIFRVVGGNLEYCPESGRRWKEVKEKSLNEAIKKRTSA